MAAAVDPSSLRGLYLPEFHTLDGAKRKVLLSTLQTRWASRLSTGPKLSKGELHEIVREQIERHHQLCDEDRHKAFQTVIMATTMSTADLMASHPHGVPVLNEVVMTMAEFNLRLNKPILHKHGFSRDPEGLAQMDQMVHEELAGDPALADRVAEHRHDLLFGRKWDVEAIQEPIKSMVKITNHISWMGLLSPGYFTTGMVMSYIHHLALPPLERRLRSYARTMALVDSVLVQVMHLIRQDRIARNPEAKREKKERVIWLLQATDNDLGKLAREGYFEDAAGFKSLHDTMVIYLISSHHGAELTGNWPCGEAVKVHAVSDHGLMLGGIPDPEMVFIFNMNLDDFRQYHMLVWLLSMKDKRPVVAVTVRCEAQARKLQDFLDFVGANCCWQQHRRESHFARNLYSGMAGSPDIEYDDNGWVTAVHTSRRSSEAMGRWADNEQYFFSDYLRFCDLRGKRWKWNDALVSFTSHGQDLYATLGYPKSGSEFSFEQLAMIQHKTANMDLLVADLKDHGLLDVVSPEEDDAIAAAGVAEPEGEVEGEEAQEDDYRVVHNMVMIRAEASTKSTALGMHQHGTIVRGVPLKVEDERWLRISHTRAGQTESGEAWMLMDGKKLGLGTLVERVVPPPAEKEASDLAKPQRAPVVFWGILDLKYDSRKVVDAQVKVLETGDGRLSRFSGYGASIKESFQQEHKLEATLRRAVITENKKLTHDVIVDNGYGHTRPRQLEFRREYDPALADRIKDAFDFQEEDICVLKLCNRARGAGVIPAPVAELDEYLQELLRPPTDVDAWLGRQPKTWSRTVTWGCFEEQVRHWWSNEAPFFLVEEFCMSMLTEKEEKYYDGTMRVGFSLHREHRDRLPRGWVDSPDGPVRVHDLDGKYSDAQEVPLPWNNSRPYLDLFRPETSILRVRWLGGYWKLPIEDVTSQDLRGKIVSVAKQGTAPVPEHDLHLVYAALGDMVPQLFGTNDLRPNTIKERYKSFPELGSFLIARLACSVRGSDKPKSIQLLELARMLLEKGSSPCKDYVASYIHRNLGVAEAMTKTQWESAAEHFRKSIQKLPANANSRHLLGLHYLEIGVPHKAVEILEEALLLDPDFKAPYACLGAARLQLAQYPEAEEVSRAGLLRHPYTPACQYNLGIACFAQAVLEERGKGGGHVATELRESALTALETARDQRFRDNTWEQRDDVIVAQLRDGRRPLAWSERKLPQDGWRVMGWRP